MRWLYRRVKSLCTSYSVHTYVQTFSFSQRSLIVGLIPFDRELTPFIPHIYLLQLQVQTKEL